MRALARKSSSWEYRYGNGAQLFYEQGKLMEDYEDDFVGEGDFVMYFPTYEEMTDYELRCYFSWRTRLRAGEVTKAPSSFLFVHAYELLCGIGVEEGMPAYEELQRFRGQYAGTSTSFDTHLARWSHDYVVDHGLDARLLVAQRGSFPVAAVCTLRRAEEVLLALPGGAAWPERPVEGLPTPEELTDALVSLSRYRADRSRFFRDHREDVAWVCSRVFAQMVAHCHKRRKTDLVDGLFGVPTRMTYTMYPSAVYWSPKLHEDATFDAGDAESYVCERGFWWRVLPCRRTETSKELGALLHAIDARMRKAMGDPHALKEKSLPKYQAKFVDAQIAALIETREAEEAMRVRIDRSALGHIRSASVRTREALLTDEERGEDVVGIPVGERDDVAAPGAESAAPETCDNDQVPQVDVGTGPLTGEQVGMLRALLAGEPVPKGAGGTFVSLMVDAVNEAFLDVVGDTVVEFDGDDPVLVEDYEQDVRDALAEWGAPA